MKLSGYSRVGMSAWLGTAVVAGSLLLVCGFERPASAGQLISDGGFEATSLSSPGGFLCQNGSNVGNTCTSNLADWSSVCSTQGCAGTSTPGSLLFAGLAGYVDMNGFNRPHGLAGSLLNPPGGGNVVAIDGDPVFRSSISQTVSGLIAGDRYQLTFYQGAAQQLGLSGATTERWQVSLGSEVEMSSLMHNASQGVVPWNEQTLDFIATSTSEVLTFLAVGTPGGEPPVSLLADVSMSDIPEPASFALVAGGVLTLIAARRRRGAG